VLKKAGIVVAAAAATMVAVSPAAFAFTLIGIDDNTIQIPIQACNNSVLEAGLGIIAKGVENHDSHDGDCDQDNKVRTGKHH
jgi:hypothetical protein